MTSIGTYNYYYGAGGSQPNRRICFLRDLANPQIIKAEVYAYNKTTRQFSEKIAELVGDDICVEMKSTSDKLRELKMARDSAGVKLECPEIPISRLPAAKQDSLMSNLEPAGEWRIEVTNDIGRRAGYEKVVNLHLFNPS